MARPPHPLWQMEIGLPRVDVLLKKNEENQNIYMMLLTNVVFDMKTQ
jgi:hypothetical protein